jgi:glutathione S-transferase
MLTNDIELNAKIRVISRFHDTKLEPSIRFFFKFKKKTKYSYNEVIKGFKNVENQMIILDNIINNSKYIATDDITLADCSFPSWFALFNIFCDHFKYEISLKGKLKNYYNNLLKNKFMKDQYYSYYQIAIKWSKESLLQI